MPTKWYQRIDAQPDGGSRWACPPTWFALAVMVVLLALVGPLWLPLLAWALEAHQGPEPADALLVLGGGSGSRQEAGARLYLAGYAPVVISSGEQPYLPGFEASFAELGAAYMVSLGVPEEALVLWPDTTSTLDEALAARAYCEAREAKTLLVVTDPYHTRRARMVLRAALRGTGVRVVMVAAEPDWFRAEDWWRHERPLLAVFEEYVKTGYYALRGYFFAARLQS